MEGVRPLNVLCNLQAPGVPAVITACQLHLFPRKQISTHVPTSSSGGWELPTQETEFPIVMRMQGMWPHQLAKYEMHRSRTGGDCGHVDTVRSVNNRPLIGEGDWAQEAWEEIAEMRAENFALELEGIRKRRRKAELRR